MTPRFVKRVAAGRGDLATLAAVGDSLDRLGADADAKLDAYGLGVCGSEFAA